MNVLQKQAILWTLHIKFGESLDTMCKSTEFAKRKGTSPTFRKVVSFDLGRKLRRPDFSRVAQFLVLNRVGSERSSLQDVKQRASLRRYLQTIQRGEVQEHRYEEDLQALRKQASADVQSIQIF